VKESDNMNMDEFRKAMDKQFGENTLIEFDKDEVARVESISTGIPSLDLATGVGGFPRGRIIEVFGPEGAGKTTVVLKAMAQSQKDAGKEPRITYKPTGPVKKLTGRAGLIDVEHAFDPSLAIMHGMEMGKDSGFYMTQPSSGMEAMRILEMMIDSDLFDIIALDSVAGLATDDEIKADVKDKTMASVAQLMSTNLKQLTSKINKSRTVVIFVNQIREKPAVLYGSPETTPGGRSLKFYSSMRMRVAKGESIMEGTLQIGHRWKVKIVKNKVAPPFSSTEVDLYYRDSEKKGKKAGFDIWSDIIDAGKEMGIIEQGGSQYRFVDSNGEMHKANGLVALKDLLESRPDVFEEISNLVAGVGSDVVKQNEQE
jgi:recombination protein RecA